MVDASKFALNAADRKTSSCLLCSQEKQPSVRRSFAATLGAMPRGWLRDDLARCQHATSSRKHRLPHSESLGLSSHPRPTTNESKPKCQVWQAVCLPQQRPAAVVEPRAQHHRTIQFASSKNPTLPENPTGRILCCCVGKRVRSPTPFRPAYYGPLLVLMLTSSVPCCCPGCVAWRHMMRACGPFGP